MTIRRSGVGMVGGDGRDDDFSEFVVTSWARLVGMAELLTGDLHRARDLVQIALERCYPRWSRIRDGDPYGYVRRAVVNAHNDWWRRSGHRELAVRDLPDRPGDGDLAAEQSRRDTVRRALATLSRRERSVIVLRYFEDLSEERTAAVLDIAAGTVKSTASRALAKLRVAEDLSDERTPAHTTEANP